MGGNRLIQINVNHASSAQDLLHQVMVEKGVDIAVVAEPYRVPPGHSRWVSDPTGKDVALTWQQEEKFLPCISVEAGEGYTAVRGRWLVVGVYISPRHNLREFECRLDIIKGCVSTSTPGLRSSPGTLMPTQDPGAPRRQTLRV